MFVHLIDSQCDHNWITVNTIERQEPYYAIVAAVQKVCSIKPLQHELQ